MTRIIFCVKLGKEAEGLAKPPFPGPLGLKIMEQVSQEAWRSWLARQTMFINEYRLNLLENEAREFLKTECQKFLFEQDPDRLPEGFREPNAS